MKLGEFTSKLVTKAISGFFFVVMAAAVGAYVVLAVRTFFE